MSIRIQPPPGTHVLQIELAPLTCSEGRWTVYFLHPRTQGASSIICFKPIEIEHKLHSLCRVVRVEAQLSSSVTANNCRYSIYTLFTFVSMAESKGKHSCSTSNRNHIPAGCISQIASPVAAVESSLGSSIVIYWYWNIQSTQCWTNKFMHKRKEMGEL